MISTFEYESTQNRNAKVSRSAKKYIHNCCVYILHCVVHTLLPDIVWIPAFTLVFVACEEVDVSLVTFFLVTPASTMYPSKNPVIR